MTIAINLLAILMALALVACVVYGIIQLVLGIIEGITRVAVRAAKDEKATISDQPHALQ